MASLVVIDLTLDSDDDVAVVLSAPRLRISMKTKPSEQDLASISSNPPALSLKPSTTSLNLNVEVADGFDTSIFDDEAELELLEKIAAVKQITVDRAQTEMDAFQNRWPQQGSKTKGVEKLGVEPSTSCR